MALSTFALALFCVAELRLTARTQPPAGTSADRQLLNRYCVGCHNDRARIGGLSLEALDFERVGQDPSEVVVWEKVIRKLAARAMPPAGRPWSPSDTYDAFVDWLAADIDRVAARSPNPGRRPSVHRLNRAEYANAIRELLGIEADAPSLLPPDDSGYGFDNIADVLSVSPTLTERFLAAARKISQLAVGDPTLPPP